eukprot:TRINITY_DN15415_c0_g1_i1.p1 TRINITY_DN15415_c0_g1~~TRINITY_DN15415_c0_g1_i1.p1  ORF type:complete len:401 (+),score=60.54 TRINITY_DN15415_c0_g1_i1:158-1204(+)
MKEIRRDFYEWVRKDTKYDGEFARAEKCLNRYLVSKDCDELRNELTANGVSSDKLDDIIRDTDSAMKSISVPEDGNNLQPTISGLSSDTISIKLTRSATCKVPKTQFDKLKRLYLHSNHSPSEEDAFLLNIALVHYRYYFLSGGRSGLQDAIPTEVMKYLINTMDVSIECFASPFNATLPVYCSMFKDSDKAFGSVGSFFDFEPTEGSFEANPPFTESVMSKMHLHMIKLLQNSTGPMSFTIVIPHWTDPVPESVQKLTSSTYFNTSFLIPASEHSYCDGFTFNQTPLFFRDTLVIILTNPQGSEKWSSVLKTIATDMKSIWKSASSADIKRSAQSGSENLVKRPKAE